MAIHWDPALDDLINLLADLYDKPVQAQSVVRKIGLNPTSINFHVAPKDFWTEIVAEANKHDKILPLIEVAKTDFPNIVPRLPRLSWKLKDADPAGGLEAIIGKQPTLLPINFLEIGMLRARSVARVKTPLACGTGFLTGDDLLITNNHVILTENVARDTKVWFNYQRTVGGALAQPAEYTLAPEKGFATDEADDWTAVRVEASPTADWGRIDLVDATIEVGDFVNIIQHPEGKEKQIALYHNVVEFADDSRVQYLTDTMKGSSGSPVFDSEWRVVALHYRGGKLLQPGTNKEYLRNEGLHIRALLSGLRQSGLLNN